MQPIKNLHFVQLFDASQSLCPWLKYVYATNRTILAALARAVASLKPGSVDPPDENYPSVGRPRPFDSLLSSTDAAVVAVIFYFGGGVINLISHRNLHFEARLRSRVNAKSTPEKACFSYFFYLHTALFYQSFRKRQAALVRCRQRRQAPGRFVADRRRRQNVHAYFGRNRPVTIRVPVLIDR